MKHPLICIYVISFLLFSCIKQNSSSSGIIQNKNEVLNNIDWKTYNLDLQYVDTTSTLPLGNDVFPVNEYDSEGNGYDFNKLQFCNYKFIQQSAFVYQGDYNASFFENAENPDDELIYFSVLVKTSFDSIEAQATSRNHPVYLSQGVVNIEKNRKISWIAIRDNETNHDIAIVNMKYFDLNKGRLVIVIPIEDGSLRFKQVDIKQESIFNLKNIIEEKKESWCFEIDELMKLGK